MSDTSEVIPNFEEIFASRFKQDDKEYQEYLKCPPESPPTVEEWIAELLITKEIEATDCKITDSLEVGITDEDGQVTIHQISGMDGHGITNPQQSQEPYYQQQYTQYGHNQWPPHG